MKITCTHCDSGDTFSLELTQFPSLKIICLECGKRMYVPCNVEPDSLWGKCLAAESKPNAS